MKISGRHGTIPSASGHLQDCIPRSMPPIPRCRDICTFAGFIANKLLVPGDAKQKQEPITAVPVTVALADLKNFLDEREKVDAEIASRIENLEQLLAREQASGKKEGDSFNSIFSTRLLYSESLRHQNPLKHGWPDK